MNEVGRGIDQNRVGMIMNHNHVGKGEGTYRAWVTRNGIPVRGLQRRDGSAEYESQGHNILTDAMRNLIRDAVSRLGVSGAGGPAGGFWTQGPFVGLSTGTLTASTTLSTLSEATGNGYVAGSGRGAPTWQVNGTGGFNMVAAVSWTASGGNLGGGALNYLFTTPSNTTGAGTQPNNFVISVMALNGGPYTVAAGNTLNVTYGYTFAA